MSVLFYVLVDSSQIIFFKGSTFWPLYSICELFSTSQQFLKLHIPSVAISLQLLCSFCQKR